MGKHVIGFPYIKRKKSLLGGFLRFSSSRNYAFAIVVFWIPVAKGEFVHLYFKFTDDAIEFFCQC